MDRAFAEAVVKDLLTRLTSPPQAEKKVESTDQSYREGKLGSRVMEGLRDAIMDTKSYEDLRKEVKVAKSLLLQKGSLGDQGITSLVRAFKDSNVSNLRHLDVSDNGITEQGFGGLTEALGAGALSGLEHLNVSHNLIREDGSESLAKILRSGRLASLQHLNLSHCYISDNGLKSLAEAMESGQFSSWGLQTLDICGNVFGELGIIALANALGMGRLPYLKYLNLSYNMLGEQGAIALAQVIQAGQLSGLTHLHLTRCYLGDGLIHIAGAMEVGKLPNLQSLDLCSNYLGEFGAIAVANAVRSGNASKLQSLNLSQCGIRAEKVVLFTEAIELGRVWDLRHLDLSHNTLHVAVSDLKDQGTLALVRLIKNGRLQRLQYLNLSHCFMTDMGVSALGEEMEVGHLSKLHRCLLIDNDVTSERTLFAIVRALESGNIPDLIQLELGHNSLGDDVTMALANLLAGTAVRGPLVQTLKERLWSHKGPMESITDQLIKFLEIIAGWKLKPQSAPGLESAWNRKLDRHYSHLVVEEGKPSENCDKFLFNLFLFGFWAVAVLTSWGKLF